MVLLVIWIIMAFVVMGVAISKGFRAAPWFAYGFLLWPIALIHVLVARPDEKEVEAQQLRSGDRRRCPHCAELIKYQAKVCRYCGRDVDKPKEDNLPADADIGDMSTNAPIIPAVMGSRAAALIQGSRGTER